MQEKIQVATKGSILKVTLNRPEAHNAIDDDMYRMISEALDEATRNSSIRALLINGNGNHFCAGNDLNDFKHWPEMASNNERLPVFELIERIIKFPKILVASVSGYAVGIGATLMLHCDIVIASRNSQFIFPFTKLGLVPEFGSTKLMQELIGPARARELLLLNGKLDGPEAYRVGLASSLCEEDQLDDMTTEKCRQLEQLPAYTLLESKKLLHPQQRQEALLKQVEMESELFLECLQQSEHKAVIENFFKTD